jgi:hypothetical protein
LDQHTDVTDNSDTSSTAVGRIILLDASPSFDVASVASADAGNVSGYNVLDVLVDSIVLAWGSIELE